MKFAPRYFVKAPLPTADWPARVTEPLGYLRFLGMVANCGLVLTDSGGIQEETTVLGIPCITMRPNTERPINCEIGTNILSGNDPARVRAAIASALSDGHRRGAIPPKWDGHAAERIVEALVSLPDPALHEESPVFVG